MFDISVVWDYRESLLSGLWVTFWVSMVSILAGFIIGALTCLARTSKNATLRAFSGIYISAFRGTPLLVQLTIIFFFLPLAGINIPAILAAIIGLTLNSGAFQAEILRGGFQVLPKGQVEAAWGLGLTRWQCLVEVELPQVIRTTLPALVNETIDIIKNSSLISIIAVTELMRISQQYSSTTYRPLEFFMAAGFLYLVLTISISKIGRLIEYKLDHK